MKNQKLYIKSSEFDFLKEPSFIKDYQIIKRGWSELMVANLENPISIWHRNKLHSYTKALLKPRYYFSSFKKISKKPIEVNIASLIVRI